MNRVRVVRDLAPEAERIGALLTRVGAPVTARWPWLSTWAATHPSWRALAVLAEDADGGLGGVALLATQRRGPLLEVVALGHVQSDYVRFPASDPDLLAHGLARWLRQVAGPWRLRVQQLPAGDPVLTTLADVLPAARLLPGDPSPMIDVRPGLDLLAISQRNARTRGAQARNRLRRDGRQVTVEATRDQRRIAELAPVLERVRRDRDLHARGESGMDDEEERQCWYALLAASAAASELEVTTLRIDGDVAAYCVGFLDGRYYRFWDFRFAPRWASYSPGLLLRFDVLTRVAEAGEQQVFDWMRGAEPYKFMTPGRLEPAAQLRAWSSPALRVLEDVARRVVRGDG